VFLKLFIGNFISVCLIIVVTVVRIHLKISQTVEFSKLKTPRVRIIAVRGVV
jgi:hypothetical protein